MTCVIDNAASNLNPRAATPVNPVKDPDMPGTRLMAPKRCIDGKCVQACPFVGKCMSHQWHLRVPLKGKQLTR